MLKSFIAAPHRVMFFGGAVQTLLAMSWWLFELGTRYLLPQYSVSWPLFPTAAHIWLLLFGMLPFFFFGFLMTTFPRWMAGNEIPVQRYVPAFVFMFAGVSLFYAGLFLAPVLLILASASMLVGWGGGLYALWRVLRDTRPSDKRHTSVLLAAFSIGWLALAVFLYWQVTGRHEALQLALRAGLWGFVLPVFATVAHRMIPFFTSSALQQKEVPRPFWPWWTMLAASLVHGLLEFFSLPAWLWLADLPLAFAALKLSWLWGFRRSFKNPLLAVLHVGFVWLGIAMLLYAVQSLWLLTHDGTGFILGLAPLHALTIGCYATLMIGMGTRVTLGHSGLPFAIDTPVQLMFAGIQLTALLRIAADLLPAQSGWLYLAATLLWLACFGPWVWRYLPAYWRPRADGQPG
ncbi:MAG: NnrS family protein [Gammaproteobacteria bacterium]|nr:NnrS family protein [Sideroxydans sp.]MBU3902874.1 NnrS family protein [Gammaproteobacteria bacterium]MBU4150040.1 NnrS family protein [Gammaproteobacteria bacterium]